MAWKLRRALDSTEKGVGAGEGEGRARLCPLPPANARGGGARLTAASGDSGGLRAGRGGHGVGWVSGYGIGEPWCKSGGSWE